MVELSVVIPVYNESKIVRRNLEIVDNYLQTLGTDYEIIVVNDGSTDDTLKLISSAAGKYVRIISYPKNQGKGFAVNQGMTAAFGRYRLFMDMDLSTDLTEIPKFLVRVREGLCDICVGNRHYVRLSAQHRPWPRALLGKVFATLSVWATGCRLDDFTCGFKIFTAEACTAVFPRQRIFGWAFDTELMAIAQSLRLRIRQESVAWHHHGNSKVRIGSAMITATIDLGKIWYFRTFRPY